MSVEPDEARPEFVPGCELCDGRFVVQQYVHRGGVGAVYLVRDTVFDQDVALKIAHDSTDLTWAEMRMQFSKLVHIGSRDVVKPLGIFVHLDGSGRRPVVALEWIDGMDFDQWTSSPDGTDVKRRLSAIARIATALAELHERGLAHGDLFGGNVRVASDRIVLIDVDSEATAGNPKGFDRGSLRRIIEMLLPDYTRTALAVIVNELKAQSPTMSMKDVAAQINSVARNPPLIDLQGPLLTAAVDSHRDAIAEREARYEFVRRQRTLTIDRLTAQIRALAERFGFPVTTNNYLETPRAANAPGFLATRIIDVESDLMPNLHWLIQFEQVDGFYKPYPYPGGVLIANASSTISGYGVSRDDLVEIRLENDAPVIYTAVNPAFEEQGDISNALERMIRAQGKEPKWVPLDDDWMKRCFAALTGKMIG